MRATAVLRRPVPKCWTNPATQIPFLTAGCWGLTAGRGKTFGALRDRQFQRLLRLMGMLVACIDLQLAVHLFAELVLREHSRDCVLDHLSWTRGAHAGGADFGEAARITGVAAIKFLAFLAAGELYFCRVNHDDVIPSVQEGGIGGLVLAHQDIRR